MSLGQLWQLLAFCASMLVLVGAVCIVAWAVVDWWGRR